MKIILVRPPVTLEEVYGKYSDLAAIMPPLGLCSLAAYLIKHGYKEVKIIDASAEKWSIDKVVKEILEDKPDLVGIYTNTTNYYATSRLASQLKMAKDSQKIVVGGPHPTFLPRETLGETEVDYCVIGEGEQTLLGLVQHIDSNSNELNKIDGLAYRTIDNQIVINKPRNSIADLDSLPFPVVHLLPSLSRYRLYLLHYKRLPFMQVETSRGCPFNCIFCITPFGKAVRYHSPEYVVDHIDYLVKHLGIKELVFSDDTFTLDENKVSAICNLIQKRNIDVTWYANIRANIKNKGIFYEMKRAGCWICAIGVESGDSDILHLIGKDISLDEVKLTCEAVLRANLILKTFFILGNPGETLETIERTIRLAKSLKSHFPIFSLMTPYPGTNLWEVAQQYGTFDRSNFQKLTLSTSDPVFIPYGLTKEILLQKQKEAFRKTYCNLGMVMKQLSTIDSLNSLKKLMKAALVFLKVQKSN